MAEDTSGQRTAALFAWLNRVKQDASMPASAFKVAFELGQWINGETFDRDAVLVAWPSLETIGAAIGMSERTARDMVKRLELRGHLSIRVGHGPGHPSRYILSFQNRQQSAALPQEETGSRLPHSDEQNRKPASRKPAGYDMETGSRLPTNHLEPSKNQGESSRATRIPDDFKLSDQNYNWALGKLGSNEAVDRSIFRLINHSRDKGTLSKDWQAKACNWIDRDAAGRQSESLSSVAARLAKSGVVFGERPRGMGTSFGEGAAATEKAWDDVISTYARNKTWTRHVDQFGPDPSSPACRAPRHLLAKHGIIKGEAA